jgi:hypothetical protein
VDRFGGIMATAATLISAAFTKIGVATPTAAQNTAALSTLNDLITLQGADFMQPFETSFSHSLTIGDQEYTIGATATAGNFVTPRPLKINSCFLRDADGSDHHIKIISAKEYNNLFKKGLTGVPEALYYSPEYLLGKIYFDYAPAVAYDAYLNMTVNFTEFALSSTSVSLPEEYRAFLVYNLAIGLAEDWDRAVSKTLYAMAIETKNILDRLHATNKPPPLANFDIPISIRGSQRINSDDGIDGGAF